MRIKRREMGRYLVGEDRSDDFGMGTTTYLFHSVGTCPSLIERLKSLVTDGAMLVAVCLSIVADTSSGPVALDTSRFLRRCSSSSVVQKSSAKHLGQKIVSWFTSDKAE